MSQQTLKDKNNKILGYIETRPDGTQVIKDFGHRIKGYYEPKSNKTKDAGHRIVGTGNLLTSLL